jgi:hypothetical protein
MKNLFKNSSPVAWFVLGVLVAGGTGTAYAANGGTFRLGQSNSATATTKLTNTKGTALKVVSKAGTPPISVGSNSTKVPYFNADKLDGKDSTQFQAKLASTLKYTSFEPNPGWSYSPQTCGELASAPAVAKSAEGIAHLKGFLCYPGGLPNPAGQTLGTVPAGFTPSNTVVIPAVQNGFNTGVLVINPAGVISVVSSQTSPGSGSVIFLTGLSFPLS